MTADIVTGTGAKLAMRFDKAIQILEALGTALDCDAATGRPLPGGCPKPFREVTDALDLAVRALRNCESRMKRRATLPGKAYRPWTLQEEAELLRGFQVGTPLPQLARQHQRTTAAIKGRIYRLAERVR